jgi:hypothetical protein
MPTSPHHHAHLDAIISLPSGGMPMIILRLALVSASWLLLSTGAHAQSNHQSPHLFELCFQAGRLGNAICDKQSDPGQRLDCLQIVRAEQFECVQRMLPEEEAVATATNAGPLATSSQADNESSSPDGALASTPAASTVGPTDNGQLTEAPWPAPAIRSIELGQPTASLIPHPQSVEPTDPIGEIEPTKPTVGTNLPAQVAATMQAARPAVVDESAIAAKVDPPNDNVNAKTEETKWVVSETTSPVDYSPLISATIRPRQLVNSGFSALTISCRAKRLELSLRLTEELNVPRFGEIYIVSQINDQRAVKQRWIWDEEGIILAYVEDAMVLLQSIPDGARLRLGIADSSGARHVATYQFIGLDTVRRRFEGACAWPVSAQASSEAR